MAFCTMCGAEATGSVCPRCGAAIDAPPPPPGYTAGSSYSGSGFSGSGAPGYAAGATAPPPGAGTSAPVAGFLASLFDFSFTTFITTKLIRVLYILGMVLAGFSALGFAFSGFAHSFFFGLFTLVIVAPLMFLAFIIYSRVVLELIIVLFRASEHLAEIARQGRVPLR